MALQLPAASSARRIEITRLDLGGDVRWGLAGAHQVRSDASEERLESARELLRYLHVPHEHANGDRAAARRQGHRELPNAIEPGTFNTLLGGQDMAQLVSGDDG